MKTLKFGMLLLLSFALQAVNAQKTRTDSLIIIRAAKTDAKKFRLDKEELKKLRKLKFNPHSDYFKPTPNYTSNASLLTDSLYHQAFSEAAHKRVLRKENFPLLPTVIVIAGTAVLTYVLLVVLFVFH